jgi:pyruvate/2-oxoglutarate dehydrogenase complex dihydrolipoamide acyltransferase (E2) component
MAMAVARNPGANTVLFKKMFWGYRAVKFKNVDVNLPITRKVDDRLVTFIGTIRMADKKSLIDIQAELTHLQHCPESESEAIARIRKFSKMPLWLSLLVHWWMTKSAKFYIKQVGSCGMTLMQGKGERFFPIGPTSAIVGFGVPAKAPAVDDSGEVVAIRTLKCVVMVDNYVVSGLVGAKLVQDLIDLMEEAEVFND